VPVSKINWDIANSRSINGGNFDDIDERYLTEEEKKERRIMIMNNKKTIHLNVGSQKRRR
jgi:hypothetical protein